jgi:hypothetical protein
MMSSKHSQPYGAVVVVSSPTQTKRVSFGIDVRFDSAVSIWRRVFPNENCPAIGPDFARRHTPSLHDEFCRLPLILRHDLFGIRFGRLASRQCQREEH